MKIAILGTRGIPNAYGGFEQCAEFLSVGLKKKGHEVYVYNSHNHPYQGKEWNGINIIHKYDPEQKIGTVGQFIYDFNCIMDSRRKSFDIILQLGYTSSSIWGKLLPKKSVILTNMDGLEWKRSKFSNKVQKYLSWAEKQAVLTSDVLISDSIGIQEYLDKKYSKNSTYIAYGSDLFETPELSAIRKYGVEPFQYDMLIARLEPENNIETILTGFSASDVQHPFLVVGKHETTFGVFLKEKFQSDDRIKFLGGIYNIEDLNNLRYFSRLYFHGHSVGGTNPSLLEAMGSNALIVANSNQFNKAIIGVDGFYFEDATDVEKIIRKKTIKNDFSEMLQKNFEKINTIYNWNVIVNEYEKIMLESYDKFHNK